MFPVVKSSSCFAVPSPSQSVLRNYFGHIMIRTLLETGNHLAYGWFYVKWLLLFCSHLGLVQMKRCVTDLLLVRSFFHTPPCKTDFMQN